MYASQRRFSHFYWLASLIAVVTVVGGAALIALGSMGYGDRVGVWTVAAGVWTVSLGIIALALVAMLIKLVAISSRQLDELRDANEVLAEHTGKLETIIANTDISDAAKSLAHRARDLDSLREAIRGEVRREDWESANHLVNQLGERFGYREEAEQFRYEIDDARRQAVEQRLSEALAQINAHFDKYELDQARAEIDRLTRALPEDPRVLGLPRQLEDLRARHKRELLSAWDDAVKRHDVDRAIEVLKGLDSYLSSEEARSLEDSARGIFKEKLMQLGVQFRFAVTEKRWRDALDVGAQIIREFPNARMAQEVRDKLEALRERAKHSEVKSS